MFEKTPEIVTDVTYNIEAVEPIEVLGVLQITEFPEELCKCGKESDYGCHGFRDEKMYNEFYCKECYSKRNDK